MKNTKIVWVGIVILLIVIGFVSYSSTKKSAVLAGNDVYSFPLPDGWKADAIGGAENGNGNSLIQVYSESGDSSITSSLTGVSSLDKKNIDSKSIDAMKTAFAKIYPGSDIKSEPAIIGGERAVVVSIIGIKNGQPFFWSPSFFVHKEILYTLLFNSTDSIFTALSDFQKVKSGFVFKQ